MRFIKMIGGLGNQMFIYAFYMDMRRRFPHTYIDLTDMMHYHAHHGYELPRIFPATKQTDEFIINRKLKKVLEFLFCRTIVERKQKQDTLRAWTRPYRWPLVYFKGFYQSERFFENIKDDVRATFQFSPEQCNHHTRDMLSLIDADDQAVSLHVRRGDYLRGKHWGSIGCVCQQPYFERAIAEMRRRHPAARFYVFSDDPAWVRTNLPLDNAHYIDWNSGVDSWQDMMLMSHCRHHIICNSTFSWWGAWLNPRPDKTVIMPHRWMAHHDMPYIAPDNWVKVEACVE